MHDTKLILTPTSVDKCVIALRLESILQFETILSEKGVFLNTQKNDFIFYSCFFSL